jgi:hypothetical protein
MLFIDDHQAQALEAHLATEQLVGADDDVDGTVFQPLQRRLDFLAGPKPRELGQAQGPV